MEDSKECNFETIVIGSGISAMTVARILSQFGSQKVLLLEHHNKLGGLTHEFGRRNKFKFATGLHYVGFRGENDIGAKLLNYITNNQITWTKMNDDFDHFVYNFGKKNEYSFSLNSNLDKLKANLINKFPLEKEAIESFYKEVPAMAADSLKLLSYKHFPILNKYLFPRKLKKAAHVLISTKEYLNKKFNDKKLINILQTFWGNLGMPPSKLPIGYLAILYWHYQHGAYYPNGGPKVIADKVDEAITQAGSVAKTRRLVKKIIVEDGLAIGVEVEHIIKAGSKSFKTQKETYYAKNIISSVGCNNTFLKLIPKGYLEDFNTSLKAIEPSPSACVLFVGLKCSPNELGFDGGNIWLMPSENHDEIFSAKAGEGLLYLSFPSLKNKEAKEHTVEIVTIANYDEFKKWKNESWPRRDKEYLEFKASIEEKILKKIDNQYPGFRDAIEFSTLATPLSISTFQASFQGQFYGMPADANRVIAEYNKIKTPIKNLYLTGQDILMPGIVPSAFSGLLTAFYILGRWKSFKLMGILNKIKIERL